MDRLPPLLFEAKPQYLRFGGDRHKGRIHVSAPIKDEPLAEVWELSDHRLHSSLIANGPFKGLALSDLMQKNQAALLGDVVAADDGCFPLMIRLLDIHENLPPAVHPTSEYSTRENLPELGKYEAAYVLSAEPGSKFYATNKPELKTFQLAEAVRDGRSFDTMQTETVSSGEVYYVSAGQLHSWGKGVVLYEVHSTSNAIFALDWMEWDKDKERREHDLRHLEKSIILDKKPNNAISPIECSQNELKRQILCANQHFVLERIESDQPITLNQDRNQFVLYTLIEGRGEIVYGEEKLPIESYRTVLIPAQTEKSVFKPSSSCVLLKVYVANLKRDVVQFLTSKGVSKEEIIALAGNAKQNDLAEYFDDDN